MGNFVKFQTDMSYGGRTSSNIGMMFIRCMLFVANFTFMMVGFVLVSIGSTVKAIYNEMDTFVENRYFSPATLTIVIGILMFFIAFLGCYGALQNSTLIINVFAYCLGAVLLLEISVAITAYCLRNSMDPTMRETMERSLAAAYNGSEYDMELWNYVQQRLRCCGVDGPIDWPQYTNVFAWTEPKSCCDIMSSYPGSSCTFIWDTGCLDRLEYIVSEYSTLLGCGALGVAFVQFLGMLFALSLARAVRAGKTQLLVQSQLAKQIMYNQIEAMADEKPVVPDFKPPLYIDTAHYLANETK